jgi:glutamate formiminotransferase / 5-formyltetrahydrofolate cyclo-ligase
LDVHSDGHHNRSVFTLCRTSSSAAGLIEPPTGFSDELGAAIEARVRMLATTTLAAVDIGEHTGVHPRIGVLDVVPFVSLRRDQSYLICDGPIEEAIEARDHFMVWAASVLGLPCFAYGPERPLPEVRRSAFRSLAPDAGPVGPHSTAGACAVGARPLLVAYNLWLSSPDVEVARSVAREVRGPAVRSLGLQVGDRVQVSCNLIDPFRTGPAVTYDAVARLAEASGTAIEHAELVGLAPMRVVEAIPGHRRPEIGVDEDRTIEARLENGPT